MPQHQSLNAEQCLAAEHLSGPVIVYAGPGTGKTKMLVHRIRHILDQPNETTSNILCLTFSNAGVASMKKKLKTLIGEKAEEVAIHTFHSFASRVIQLSGRFRGANPVIGNANAFMLVEMLLDEEAKLKSSSPVKPAHAGKLQSILNFFGQMKKQSIDEELLDVYIDNEIFYIQQNPESRFKKGNFKAVALEAIQELEQFKTYGRLFTKYVTALDAKKLYDFEDLLSIAICSLATDVTFLHEIQQQYHYVLVDEFQDTNEIQLKFLKYLLQGIKQPNLFLVGDDDQCIYKFQGAMDAGIHQLEALFGSFQKFTLVENYRSIRPILNAAHHLIQHTQDRSDLKKELRWNVGTGTEYSLPDIQYFPTYEQEQKFIAEKIQDILDEGGLPNEVAVLFRKRSMASELISWLRYYDIPFVWNSSNGDVLRTEWGKMFSLALQFVAIHSSNYKAALNLLPGLLMARFGKTSIQEVYTRYRQEKTGEQDLITWLSADSQYASYSTFINELLSIDGNQKAEKTAMHTMEKLLGLAGWRQDDARMQLVEAWDQFLMDFLDTAKRTDLIGLNRHIRYHLTHGIEIPFEQILPAGAIVLSTLHGSKGLEFDHVFMPGCCVKYWEQAKNQAATISIPSSLQRHFNVHSDTKTDMRRLVYVGVTRARKNLVMTFSGSNLNMEAFFIKEIQASEFFAQTWNPDIDPSACKEQLRIYTSDITEQGLLQQSLSSFELTSSGINGYIQNPLSFYDQHVLKIAGPTNRAMVFGSAIHLALEKMIAECDKGVPAKEDQQRVWSEAWRSFQYEIDPMHFAPYYSLGLKLLEKYVPILFPKVEGALYEVEKDLFATVGEVRLKGRLDLMIVSDKKVRVIDFKTGSGSDGFYPFKSVIDPGSAYWRQAIIYQMLAEANYPGYEVSVEFHFVENGKVYHHKKSDDTFEWISYLQQVWRQIHALQIPRYVKPSFWN